MKCSWRGGWGTKALQLESSKQLLWGFAPAAHQAVFTSRRKQASLSSSVSFLFTQRTNVKTEKDFYLKKKRRENEIIFLRSFAEATREASYGSKGESEDGAWGQRNRQAGSILMQRQQTECDLRLAKFQCKSRGARGMGLG